MKKLLFILMLTMSSVVHAEWTYIAETNNAKYYIDLTSIHQVNSYKRVWVRTEYFNLNSKMVQQFNIRSARALTEFDCREKKYRELTLHSYKQPNLIDLDISSNKLSEWEFIPSKSIADKKLLIVCNFSLPEKEFHNQKEKLIGT
jgi:hypothetical protein